jgi:hypothetical protein
VSTVKKPSLSIRELSGVFFLAVTLTAFLAGCAQSPPSSGGTSITPTPVPTQGEVVKDDDEERTGATPEIKIIPTVDIPLCKTVCKTLCTGYLAECRAQVAAHIGIEEVCVAEDVACQKSCEDDDVTEGGCNPKDLGEPKGDDKIKIEEGMSKVPVTIKHCTHGTDALVISLGTMSLVPQDGLPTYDYSLTGRGRVKGFKNFAASGFSDSRGRSVDTTKRATVTVGSNSYVWPFPGAVSFNISSKISDLDPAKNVKIIRTEVTVPEYIIHFAFLNRDIVWRSIANWRHEEDFFGQGTALDVLTYYRNVGTMNTHNDPRGKPCEFTTKLDFYYHKKAL